MGERSGGAVLVMCWFCAGSVLELSCPAEGAQAPAQRGTGGCSLAEPGLSLESSPTLGTALGTARVTASVIYVTAAPLFRTRRMAAGAKRIQVVDVSVTACDFIPEFTFPAGLSVAAVSQCPQGQFWAPAPSHGPGPRFTFLPSRSGKKPQCQSPLLLCFHSALIFTSLSGIFILRRVTLYPNWNVPWLALRRFD